MKLKKFLEIWLLLMACFALTHQPMYAVISQLEYINNGTIKLGINTIWGGGIGYFSHMVDVKNVINHYDVGRNIQQSFYGNPNGRYFDGVEWRYNPVQGGDMHNNGSTILSKVNWGDAIYVKTKPKDWSWDNVNTNDVMEQWITLRGDVAQIIYRYTYNGVGETTYQHQEMPAPYFVYDLANLAYYSGGYQYKTRSQIPCHDEGGGNGSLTTGENWAAYVTTAATTGWGCGILTPGTNYIEYFRSYNSNSGDSDTSWNANYFGPIRSIKLVSGFSIQYTAYLNIGNLSDIRDHFVNIINNKLDLALNGSFESASGTIYPGNWTPATDNGGSHTYYKDGGIYAFDGTNSVALTAESNGSTRIPPYWMQVQNGVTGGTAYKISFRVKCEQLYLGTAGIRIIQFNKSGGLLSDSGIIAASAVSGNNSSFLYKEFNFTTNSNAAKIEIRLQLNSLDDWSRVWFDSVKFSLKNI
jgi:hypothetical protein